MIAGVPDSPSDAAAEVPSASRNASSRPHDALMPIPAVARVLSLGRRKVWELVAGGELRAVRIGRSVRVDPEDLAAFIRSCKGRRARS